MNDLIAMPKPDVDGIIDSLDIAENTRREYKYRIRLFMLFVQSEGLSLNIILDYKRRLAKREDYSVSTRNKYLVCAKLFMRECYRLGLIERDITTNVKCFKQSKKHKLTGLSDEEVSLIGEWVVQHPDKLRERSLLCLALLQGLRGCEICNLRLRDIDFKAGTLMVLGKARDDREKVYLHPKTARALKRYCRSEKLQLDNYLFTSKRRPSSDGKLSTRGFQLIIKSVFAELEIDRTVHGCRHYYVTKLIKAMPGELTTVTQFTRHKSLEMLTIYNDSIWDEQSLVHYRKAFNDLSM